jgi:hypothetical protein
VRVRTGLISMNNREKVIEALGGAGISLPTSQFFSADSPWWTQEAEDAYFKFDFEKGKALLREQIDDPARSDGKAPGEKIDVELSCPPDTTLIAALQVVEQVWTGSEQVNVTLTQFDQAPTSTTPTVTSIRLTAGAGAPMATHRLPSTRSQLLTRLHQRTTSWATTTRRCRHGLSRRPPPTASRLVRRSAARSWSASTNWVSPGTRVIRQ